MMIKKPADLAPNEPLSAIEPHQKIEQGLRSLRQGKGLDGEAVIAELLAELEAAPLTR